MRTRRSRAAPGMVLGLGLGLVMGLAGCGPGATDQQGAADALPAIAGEEHQVGATGIPIDPSQKKVVVVTPPGSARTPQQQMSELQAQNARTEARIATGMKTYSGNLGNAEARDRVASGMNDDLEAYKKQSLELYKLQQQMPQAPAEVAE